MMLGTCLVASLIFTSTLATPTCDECKDAIVGLVTRLTSEASIEEQKGILMAVLCPEVEDSEACEEGINNNWEEIGGLIYNKFLEPTSTCKMLGSCTTRDWTCEDCTGGVVKIAESIKEADMLAQVVTFLQGADFCGKYPDHPECVENIAKLIPRAMPVLADVLEQTSTEICQDVVGVCSHGADPVSACHDAAKQYCSSKGGFCKACQAWGSWGDMFFVAICNDDPSTCHQPIQAEGDVVCFCQKEEGCTVGGATCPGPAN